MRRSFVPLLLLLPLTALGQESRPVHASYAEVGAFFPDRFNSSFGQDLGVYGAFGYSFRARGPVTLSGEIRGAYHPVTEGSGSIFQSPEGDLTLMGLYLDARYRPAGSRLFAGLALGLVRGEIQNRGNRIRPAVAVEGGVDLTAKVYLLARYQFGEDYLKGATLGLGFRF